MSRLARGTQQHCKKISVNGKNIFCQKIDVPKFSFCEGERKIITRNERGIYFFSTKAEEDFFVDADNSEVFVINEKGERIIIASDCMMAWKLKNELLLNIKSETSYGFDVCKIDVY